MLAREAHDRAELRIELRGLPFHDVALHGSGRWGSHGVVALPRLRDGVPVEASVELIFLQTMPDLPRPIVTTRPAEVAINSTESTKC